MAVEVYGAWGEEAQCMLSRLATRLSVKSSVPKPQAMHVKHICKALHDAGQSQCKGLAKQSYSRKNDISLLVNLV